jgi:hypothetical protein
MGPLSFSVELQKRHTWFDTFVRQTAVASQKCHTGGCQTHRTFLFYLTFYCTMYAITKCIQYGGPYVKEACKRNIYNNGPPWPPWRVFLNPRSRQSTFDVKSTVAGFFFEKSTVVGFFFWKSTNCRQLVKFQKKSQLLQLWRSAT